jgi:hypothetical protein
MTVITLDNNQLQEAVTETVLQIARALAKAECGTGLHIGKKYKIIFQATVVAPGGLNAVVRKQESSTSGEKVSTTIDEAVVEKTTRAGSQLSDASDEDTTTSDDTQDGTTSETGAQSEANEVKESGSAKTDAKEKSNGTSDGTSEEVSEGEQSSTNTQTSARGTTQETSTEYTQ